MNIMFITIPKKTCTTRTKCIYSQVPPAEVRRFMVACLAAVGVSEDKALQMAEVLVAADDRGHFSHGLNRLGQILHILASLN